MTSAPPESTLPTRLRIGACVVDLVSREVHVPDARRPARLTPKAVAVLQALAAQPGQVVTREQLLAGVWPDTLPTNDVVTQAVTQLRKALGGSEVIETIAKTGYRLLAPVEWEWPPVVPAPAPAAVEPLEAAADDAAGGSAEEASSVVPAASRQLRRRRRQLRVWAAVGVVLLVGFAGGLLTTRWLSDDAPARTAGAARSDGTPWPGYRLITSSGTFDLTPTLSPDGAMVAYTSLVPQHPGTVIMVKTTDNAPPRRLSSPGAGESDRLPAWSPDGREVAFIREGGDGRCRVMLASAGGAGDERELLGCDGTEMPSFSWSPDGRALLFGTMTGPGGAAGIRRYEIASGQWQALDYPVGAQAFDYAPLYSPDGRWIAFLRNPQMGDVWVMPAAGGQAERLTHDNAELHGLSWLPDGSGVVLGRRVASQWRLYRVDLNTRAVTDLGVDDALTPSVSASKRKLAFVQRRPALGIYRFRSTPQGELQRERLFPSIGRDAMPMVAPSGRQIVFASDRAGDYALWWANLATPESLRPIDGLVPETRQPPDWSPDSLSLLVVAREHSGEPALYEVAPALNRSVRLPVPVGRPLQAAYLTDPKRVLVLSSSDSGGAVLQLYDRSARPWRRLAELDDVSQVRFDRSRGDILFTRFSADGLWRVDEALEQASVQRVDQQGPSRWRYRSWSVGVDGQVHYLWSAGGCSTFDSVLGAGRTLGNDGRCLDARSFSTINGFSLDPGNGDLYVALAVEQGSAIGFMGLPGESIGAIGAIPKLLKRMEK